MTKSRVVRDGPTWGDRPVGRGLRARVGAVDGESPARGTRAHVRAGCDGVCPPGAVGDIYPLPAALVMLPFSDLPTPVLPMVGLSAPHWRERSTRDGPREELLMLEAGAA